MRKTREIVSIFGIFFMFSMDMPREVVVEPLLSSSVELICDLKLIWVSSLGTGVKRDDKAPLCDLVDLIVVSPYDSNLLRMTRRLMIVNAAFIGSSLWGGVRLGAKQH